MHRLAFSTNAFKKNTLTEAIDAIADAGYTGVELMADVPHAHPATFTPAQRSALRRQLDARGLAVSNVNAFTHFAAGDTYHPTWIEDDSAARSLRVAHTLGAIELAAEFGGATVSLQPGGPLIGTGLSFDQGADRFATGIEQLLPIALANHITLAIEPEPGLLIESAQEYRTFKQRYFANESSVRMNCDVGHLYCVGDDPAKVIVDQADQIAHVHLEDIGDNRVHQHLLPGKGVIDFPAIFESLESIGYGGWITVELYPFETTATDVAGKAFAHLSPMLWPRM